ncbi:hypothetical protein H1D32_24075 [Anaerobacillus sp. CMMVII]|uniref:hypothetical protein n=1 Tax=Anaerobacillus sp. CMMVII TaxID=2755588 RepID=UPI0021B79DD2|nr:hypothetical protein [Anaerobacillus sp. CMMVII]MCT8140480.1 hypothetical protein [Anaerobacillus sp. CMMVII]
MVKAFVNNIEVELFYGATLKHAILRANESLYKKVIKGQAIIKDQEGNVVDIGGSLGEGFRYFVEETE